LATKTSELQRFRAEKDHFFAHDHRAPLTHEQQHGFDGLKYFAENPQLVISARVDRKVEPGVVRMATTNGKEQVYRRFGIVHFQVDGVDTQVTLFASEGAHSHDLFLPFRDATSGKETYGAGRYLELHAHGDDVVIDFNYAYNPNCAYDPEWDCPLPPGENWLKVPIRAGEKAFPGSAVH
jgi:uncharacterized protein (DUF1684 family)